MTSPFTTTELRAWAPPPRLTPSKWAERHRSLAQGQSPVPGPWSNANAPYLTGLMDLCAIPGVAQLNICKCAQGGASEALRNVVGYFAATDPEPFGLALPSRSKGREIIKRRLIPMFQETDTLRTLMTGDLTDAKAEEVKLANGFLLHLMWAGSATSMASNPMCRVVNDEVDKFEMWTGREADPVSLTGKRLRAYGDRAIQINVSTPTTRFGQIWMLFESSDVQLWYHFACPDCGHWQRFIFSRLKWPKRVKSYKRLAAYLLQSDNVHYECPACSHKIREVDRRVLTATGQWRQIDSAPITDAYGAQHINAADVPAFPRGTRVGAHFNALAVLWTRWSAVAAEFLMAQGSLAKTFDFRTGTLGEPFERQVNKTTASLYARKSLDSEIPEGRVPTWAAKLVATVDTQHDHFYAVLRAWGSGLRSHRVWHGRLETFADLDRVLLDTPWPSVDDRMPSMTTELLLIDSGGTKLEGDSASRTTQVYTWALRRRARVRAIKGAPKPKSGLFIWPGRGFIQSDPRASKRQRKQELRIWFLAVHHYADELADFITRGFGQQEEEEVWTLSNRNDEEYNQHLSNAIKVVRRTGSVIDEIWVPAAEGARIDYFDAEVYQVAAAYMANVHLLPPQEELDRIQAARRRAADTPSQRSERNNPWKASRFKI